MFSVLPVTYDIVIYRKRTILSVLTMVYNNSTYVQTQQQETLWSIENEWMCIY